MNRFARCLVLAGRSAPGLPGLSPVLVWLRQPLVSRTSGSAGRRVPSRGPGILPGAWAGHPSHGSLRRDGTLPNSRRIWLAEWVLNSRWGQAYAHTATFLCTWRNLRWHARGVRRAFTHHEPARD